MTTQSTEVVQQAAAAPVIAATAEAPAAAAAAAAADATAKPSVGVRKWGVPGQSGSAGTSPSATRAGSPSAAPAASAAAGGSSPTPGRISPGARFGGVAAVTAGSATGATASASGGTSPGKLGGVASRFGQQQQPGSPSAALSPSASSPIGGSSGSSASAVGGLRKVSPGFALATGDAAAPAGADEKKPEEASAATAADAAAAAPAPAPVRKWGQPKPADAVPDASKSPSPTPGRISSPFGAARATSPSIGAGSSNNSASSTTGAAGASPFGGGLRKVGGAAAAAAGTSSSPSAAAGEGSSDDKGAKTDGGADGSRAASPSPAPAPVRKWGQPKLADAAESASTGAPGASGLRSGSPSAAAATTNTGSSSGGVASKWGANRAASAGGASAASTASASTLNSRANSPSTGASASGGASAGASPKPAWQLKKSTSVAAGAASADAQPTAASEGKPAEPEAATAAAAAPTPAAVPKPSLSASAAASTTSSSPTASASGAGASSSSASAASLGPVPDASAIYAAVVASVMKKSPSTSPVQSSPSSPKLQPASSFFAPSSPAPSAAQLASTSTPVVSLGPGPAAPALLTGLGDVRRATTGSEVVETLGFQRRSDECDRIGRDIVSLSSVLAQASNTIASSSRSNATNISQAGLDLEAVRQAAVALAAVTVLPSAAPTDGAAAGDATNAAGSSSSSASSSGNYLEALSASIASIASSIAALQIECRETEVTNGTGEADRKSKIAGLQVQLQSVMDKLQAAKVSSSLAEAQVQADLDTALSALASPASPLEHQATFDAAVAAATKARSTAAAATQALLASVGADIDALTTELSAVRTSVYQWQEAGVTSQASLSRKVDATSASVSQLRRDVQDRASAASAASKARLEDVTSEAKQRAAAEVIARAEDKAKSQAGEASQAAEIGRLAQELAGLKAVIADNKNVPGQERAIAALGEQLQNLRVAVALGSGGNPQYTAKVNSMYGELTSLRKSLDDKRAEEAQSAAEQRAAVERIAAQLGVLQTAVADSAAAGRDGASTSMATVTQLLGELEGVKKAVAANTAEARASSETVLARMSDQLSSLATATSSIAGEKGEALRSTVSGLDSQVRELSKAFSSSREEGEKAQLDQRAAIDRIQGQLASIAEAVAKGTDGEAVRKYTSTVAQMVQEFSSLKSAMVDRKSFEATEAAVGRMTDHIQNLRVAVALSTSGSTKHIQQVAAMNAELYALRQALSASRAAEVEREQSQGKVVKSIEVQLSELKRTVGETMSKEGEALNALASEVNRLRESSNTGEAATLASVSKMASQLDELRAAVALSQGTSGTQMAAVATLGSEIGGLRDTVERSKVDSLLAAESAKAAVESLQKQLEALASVVASTPDIVRSLSKQIEDLKVSTAAKTDLEGTRTSIDKITEQMVALKSAVSDASGEGSKQMEVVNQLALQLASLKEAVASQTATTVSSQLELTTRVERELSGLRSALDVTKAGDESVLKTILIMLEEVHTMRNAVTDALGVDIAQRSKIQELASELESVRSASEVARFKEADAVNKMKEAQSARAEVEEAARKQQQEILDKAAQDRARLEADASKLREEMDTAIAIAKMQKDAAEAKIELVRIQAQEAAAAEVERVRTDAEIQRLKMMAELEAMRRAKEDAEERARQMADQVKTEVEGLHMVLSRTQVAREEETKRYELITTEKDARIEEVTRATVMKLELEAEEHRKRMQVALEESEQRLIRAREETESRASEVLKRSEEQQRAVIAEAEAKRLEMEAALARAKAEKEAAEQAARQTNQQLQERLARAHALHEAATREIKEAAAGFQLAASLRETITEYERKLTAERKRVIYLERALGLPTSPPVVMMQSIMDAPRGHAAQLQLGNAPAAAPHSSRAALEAASLEAAAAALVSRHLTDMPLPSESAAARQLHGASSDAAVPPPPPAGPKPAGAADVTTGSTSTAVESGSEDPAAATARVLSFPPASPSPAAPAAPASASFPASSPLAGVDQSILASLGLAAAAAPPSSSSSSSSSLHQQQQQHHHVPLGGTADVAGHRTLPSDAILNQNRDAAFSTLGLRRDLDMLNSPRLDSDTAKMVAASVKAEASTRRGAADASIADHHQHAAAMASPTPRQQLELQSPRTATELMALARAAAEAASAALPRSKSGMPLDRSSLQALSSSSADIGGSTIGAAGVIGTGMGEAAKEVARRELVYGRLVEYMQARTKQAELVEAGLTPEAALDSLRHRERVVLGDSGDIAARAKAIVDKVTYEARREALGQAALSRLRGDLQRRAADEEQSRLRLTNKEPVWQDVLMKAQALPALANSPAVAAAKYHYDVATSPAVGRALSRSSDPSGAATARTTGDVDSLPPPPPPSGPRPAASLSSAAADSKSRADLEAEVAELERLAALGGRALAQAAAASTSSSGGR